jgi:gamma-glutamylcyclotransferase (GGCT)/AIG2-like uncharacterized protein YtfP
MPTNDTRSLVRSSKTAVVHKVIDITPDPAPSSTKAPAGKLLAAMARHRVGLFAVAAVLFAVTVAMLAIPHSHKAAATAAPATRVSAAPATVPAKPAPQRPVLVELNLPTAVQQGLVECQWRGNGKDLLYMDARNVSGQPLRLHLAAGQLLASVDSTIVLLKSSTLDFPVNGELHEQFPTVATSSANKVVGAEYHLSAGTLPDLDKLFAYYAAHPDTRPGAIQTTALILTENLPLSAFAKFNELNAGVQGVPESQDFKADTGDILTALNIVRDIGIDRPLAVTIDPQLEVEGMIDPASHDLAMRYYNISDEWAYWKNQLLQGDPSTRHYALYGIARYYPDIALQMLPKWARGATVSPVYRMSAVEALAQTNRAEAIPILRELEREFGGTTDLGHAAHQAANFLDAQFAEAHHGVLASAGN